ncbi:MAG TPA: NAD-dependent epimerase/dehydratase family protein [Polyangia bacterium]|nr:NAD-dependent epimerase/dehydratase family protein [Polyangia bacterium]
MKALVTGAAGFIGSNVVRALLGAGHAVRALHLPGEDVRNLAGLDVERVAGDVTDGPAMRRAAAGCDRVFHLAAIYALWTRDPERMRRVNVDGTRTVLEAARAAGVERVVYTSSIARFGGQGRGRRATEESPFALGPTGDGYSRSKFEAHEVARAFAGDVDVVIVAPTGPIGPGDVGPTPTGRLLLRALTMPVVVVPDSATNFADVRDMARGHLLAAERGRRGESYLLGHVDLTAVELAREALALYGLRRAIVRAPFPLAQAAGHASLAAARLLGRAPLFTPAAVRIARLGLTADCSKAVRELGLPQTPIRTALRDALTWFAQNGYLTDGALKRKVLAAAA